MIELFALLIWLFVRTIFAPLTEGAWFCASTQAEAPVEPVDEEQHNDQDKGRCDEIRHR